MDSSSDEGKLFIGGIGWETTEEMLKDHFAHYGDVSHVVIMRDRVTSRPRGFGFVVFSDPNVLAKVLHETHVIDGRTVEAKKAMSREQQKSAIATTNNNGPITANNNFTTGPNNNPITKTKKIFVGGLPSTLTEDQFKQYFQDFGEVTDVVIMYDSHTGRPRGFGFITFTAEESMDRVLHKTFHELNSKLVEVKRALPKDSILGPNNVRRDSNGYYSTGGNRIFGGQFGNNGFVQLPQQLTSPYSGYGNFGYGYLGGGNGFGYNGYGGGYGFGGYGNNLGLYSNPSNSYSSNNNNNWRNQNLGYGGSLYAQSANYGRSGAWRNGSRSGSNGSTRRSVAWNASKADTTSSPSNNNSNGDAERGRTENGGKVEGPLCNGDVSSGGYVDSK